MEKSTRKVRRSSKARSISTARDARSLRVNVKTGRDFAAFMSGLMTDVVSGKVDPRVANAACNAGGKLLKIVDMEFKYSRQPRPKGAVVNAGSLALTE